ncbi:GldG family protein [Candidatus Parcubacteria bacterium]|nr:GldG family protein [Candidatus Parcubacteria bacterium]
MSIVKKFKNRASFSVSVLIIIGILIVINIISYQIFHRFDLTESNDYSISKTTKDMLKNLDDTVEIKVCFSRELPPNFINIRQEVNDILDEYKNYSAGKVKIEDIFAEDDLEIEQKMQELGIPKLQFNIKEKDKFQAIGGYAGLVVYFGDKKEVISVIQTSKNLEYEITAIIKKLTLEKIPTIAFATGHNEKSPIDGLANISEVLRKQYSVISADLSQGDLVSDEVDTLIILGASSPFDDRSKYIIDQFLMRGGSLMIAQDGVLVSQGMAGANLTGLEEILSSYGVKINADLVLDVSNEVVNIPTGFFPIMMNYPFWPKILAENFDQDNPATANLETAFFPWASSLEILSDRIGDKQVFELAKTTEKSWAIKENFNLDPQQQFIPQGQKQNILAVSVFGKFSSFYQDKDRPQKEVADGEVALAEEFIFETENGRLVVIGDSEFAQDSFLSSSNLILFQNIVDSLALDQDLINIRSKGITSRPLQEMSDAERNSMKYFNIFGVTILVIIFGIARYNLRKKKRFEG